jgi:hypothetical protein
MLFIKCSNSSPGNEPPRRRVAFIRLPHGPRPWRDAFLADPASAFITGVALEVDGGRCI